MAAHAHTQRVSADTQPLLQVPRTAFQVCSKVHSCHSSRTHTPNCEADRSAALARAQVSVGRRPLVVSSRQERQGEIPELASCCGG